ncbi:AraC family transcriptional regulator [Flavicella marina]|uniref:AraC family transcriptional regulator n=1 Tax=Flavicella marina TaxID=1475951 RepID=UPI0012657DCB|nr:AraC family transcriptional regulator [Flavicella marina]
MKIYSEITPLEDNNIFVIQKHQNAQFDYPIHLHPEFEINLILNCSGSRFVGDSVHKFEKTDLVLLGSNLYHKWERTDNHNSVAEVITIQFSKDFIKNSLLNNNSFKHIKLLLENSSRGLSFNDETKKEVIPILKKLIEIKGFDASLEFLSVLNLLAKSNNYQPLASVGFSLNFEPTKKKLINKVYDYILENYSDETLSLKKVAALNNMSESAFSIFFKKRAHKNFTQFVIDFRISKAVKSLQETNDRIREIAFDCGFNNISNFNRIFKKNTKLSPSQYREKIKKLNNFIITETKNNQYG